MDPKDLRDAQLDAWLALTGRTPLPAGQTVRLPVLSGSMLPLMPIDAILEIEAVAPESCRIGDVVVFPQRGGRLTAHRVISVLALGPWRLILQKGDNWPFGGWIRANRVRGRVIRVIPADGDESAAVEAYSPETARESLGRLRTNLIRYWPRRIRDALVEFLRKSEK